MIVIELELVNLNLHSGPKNLLRHLGRLRGFFGTPLRCQRAESTRNGRRSKDKKKKSDNRCDFNGLSGVGKVVREAG